MFRSDILEIYCRLFDIRRPLMRNKNRKWDSFFCRRVNRHVNKVVVAVCIVAEYKVHNCSCATPMLPN